MADIHINKAGAAQRQIDAAVRILFSGEDVLAVHTIVNAAHGILTGLDDGSGKARVLSGAYETAFERLRKKFPEFKNSRDSDLMLKAFRIVMRRPANFLKHADRDATGTLDVGTLRTDHMLLEACSIYTHLGFTMTTEMRTFVRWHMAVCPHEEVDKINTTVGFVHEMDRHHQLEFGAFLLARMFESAGAAK